MTAQTLSAKESQVIRFGVAAIIGALTWGALSIIELRQTQAVLKETAVSQRELRDAKLVDEVRLKAVITELVDRFGREQVLALEPLKVVMEQNRRELEKIRSELADARKD